MSWWNPFAAQNVPNNEPECMTHYNAALRKMQMGQLQEAYSGLLYSVKLDDEYKVEQRVSQLMKVCEQMGKYDDMISITGDLLVKKPNCLTYLVWRGVAYKNLNKYDECSLCFEKACNLQPHNEMFVNLYCSVLMKQSNWSKFVEVNKRMIDGKPTAATYHNNYVQGLENLGKKDAADQHIIDILNKYGATVAGINFIAGDYYYKHEQFDQAEMCQKKAAELDYKNEKFQEYYIRSLLQNGKQDEANKYCQELLNKNSGNIKWINTVGYILFDAFDYENSLKHFKKCMDLQPNDPYYAVDYAMVLCELNRLNEAEILIQNILNKNNKLTHVQYRYARILEFKKEYSKSQEIYKNILKIRPNQGKINMGYAHLLYLMKNYSESMKYFGFALNIDKMNPWTHYWYALLLITDEYKKYSEAEESFQHCLKLQITHHKCHFQYSLLLFNILNTQKNQKKAIFHMKEASKIDYNNDNYKKILKEMIDSSKLNDDNPDDDDDKKNDDNNNDNVSKFVRKEYVFKSINNNPDDASIICLDNDFNDILFKLDSLNINDIKNINEIIKKGEKLKKDVKIVVIETHSKNNKITQKISHAKI